MTDPLLTPDDIEAHAAVRRTVGYHPIYPWVLADEPAETCTRCGVALKWTILPGPMKLRAAFCENKACFDGAGNARLAPYRPTGYYVKPEPKTPVPFSHEVGQQGTAIGAILDRLQLESEAARIVGTLAAGGQVEFGRPRWDRNVEPLTMNDAAREMYFFNKTCPPVIVDEEGGVRVMKLEADPWADGPTETIRIPFADILSRSTHSAKKQIDRLLPEPPSSFYTSMVDSSRRSKAGRGRRSKRSRKGSSRRAAGRSGSRGK